MSPNGETRASWVAVLDLMEAELTADPLSANRISRHSDTGDNGGAWAAPAYLGPIPFDLRDRASSILAAQREAIERLREQQQVTAQHLTAVRSVPSVHRRDQSIYVDVAG
ncbi:MAG: hypothetical protein JWP30_1963 [Homoserinimonas sp.]|nr:hypothetical protein [Homoserinimonas sp.]